MLMRANWECSNFKRGMNTLHIACVVEGKGEELAIRELLQRIALRFAPGRVHVEVSRPLRFSRDKLVRQEDELIRAVELASFKLRQVALPDQGLLLVLLDADDDCPAEIGPRLLASAGGRLPSVDIEVSLAMREFEAWFLAAAPSLAGQRGLPEGLARPDQPESIRGAKEWLRKKMPRGHTYSPTIDQPAFVRIFDLDEAVSHAPSFARFVGKIEDRLRTLLENE